MRVLYFHHDPAPSGAAKSLSLVIRQLTEAGVHATVAVQRSSKSKEVATLFEDSGAEVIEDRGIRPFHGSTVAPNASLEGKLYAIGGYLPALIRSYVIMKEVKPDLIHLNSTSIVAAAHAAKLFDHKVPVISHVREPILKNTWGGLLRKLNRRYVDHFISIDEEGARSLGVEEDRSTVIRNSAPDEYFDIKESDMMAARAHLGWSNESLIILSLARPIPANGALEMVRLIQQVESAIPPEVRFVIAGLSPSPASEYEARLANAIDACERCVAEPFVKDVRPYLAASDALIVPFLSSHSARSVFEGAASGRPVLVTDLPNLTELIVDGETGLTFDITDPQSFLSALAYISNSERRLRMVKNAKRFAHLKFNEVKNADLVFNIYRRLLEVCA